MSDLYQTVTDRIIAALEAGVPPWVRQWSTGVDTLPMNASSKRPYRGVNVVLLALEAQARGYALNRWLTYRQASELGGQVRRGESGTTVVFWKLRRIGVTADFYPDANEPDLHERVIPLLRAFTVFNVAQVDGLPAELAAISPAVWQPEARAEELLLMSAATIRHGGAQAYYHSGTDQIHLPPRQAFSTADRYYATALHELTHWTSNSSRCNRQLGKRFGDDAYALEELVAEMGSAFLCAHCRIDGHLQGAAYVDHWLRVLRADKRAILVASTRAQQASDYIVNLADPTRADARLA